MKPAPKIKVRRTAVYTAQQFDPEKGTIPNRCRVLAILAPHQCPKCGLNQSEVSHARFVDPNGVAYTGRGPICPGDWVVVMVDGGTEIVPNFDFERMFEEVPA